MKNRKDLGVQQYMKLYYQLLYNHTVEETKKIVVDKFNKNKNLTRKNK